MNQDSSFPPMLPPSTELGAILFAILPCLQEAYRPLASFAYHMTELTKLKSIPAMPNLSGLSGIETFVTDKDIMLRSLSFYGKMFRMPLLSTIATLLQGFQFYQAYKDILPGIFSGMNNSEGAPSSSLGSMAGLFSGLGGLGSFGGNNATDGSATDLFSMLGGLSPELLSSLLSGFSGGASFQNSGPASPPVSSTAEAEDHNTSASADSDPIVTESAPPENNETTSDSIEATGPQNQPESPPPADELYNSLYSFLTPEQQKIYEQLMHTD